MNKYTVLMQVEYPSCNESYLAWVEGVDFHDALCHAETEAAKSLNVSPRDLQAVFACVGHVEDLTVKG